MVNAANTHERTCSRILSLLTDNPSANEIARAIAFNFLHEFNVTKVRISAIRSDDSLIFLGDHGFAPSTVGQVEASEVWHARDDAIRRVELKNGLFGFNSDRTCAGAVLTIRGVTAGVLAIYFASPLTEQQAAQVEEIVDVLMQPLSLFFFIRPNAAHVVAGTVSQESVDAARLSDRQMKILTRMADGHTNHEIASALGFSVSTIRHETMRIFQILSVSDRLEAGNKARALGLVTA